MALNIPGATSSSYAFTNAAPTNAGNYSVLLTNAAGSTLSSNAVLTVDIPPLLASDPFASAVTSGGTAYSPGAALIGQTNAAGLV